MAVTRRQYAIRNAKDFFSFCEAELKDVGKSVFPSQVKKYEHSSRTFFYCDAQDINRDRKDRNVKTVKGTMNIHCVAGTGNSYQVRTRDLTCTCEFCWFGVGDSCQDEPYVGKWKDVKLQMKSPDGTNQPQRATDTQSQLECDRIMNNQPINQEQQGDSATAELGSADNGEAQVDDFVAVRLRTARGKRVMYLAKVLDIDEEDVQLRFLATSSTPGVYTWKKGDSSWQSKDDIINIMSSPKLLPGRGLLLQFDIDEMKICNCCL